MVVGCILYIGIALLRSKGVHKNRLHILHLLGSEAYYKLDDMGEDLNQMFYGMPPCDEDDDDKLRESSDDDEDFGEDAASSPNSPPPLDKTTSLPPRFDANEPLYDLPSLTAQLPIRRGLSKYYQGKSQSFTSLSDVRCLEDLPKKETPLRRKMKSCRSYAGGLDGSPKSQQAPPTSSKTISKKAARGYCASSISSSGSKPPSIPVQKNLCLH